MTRYNDRQNKHAQKYIAANYDDIKIRVPKGERDKYKAHAEKRGKSLNQLVIDLLDEDIQKLNE